MTASGAAVRELLELPVSERVEALENIVLPGFKDILYMDEDEEFPMDQSFFDLGITSLRLTEIKEHLEVQLGAEIDANSLFNNPTLESLLQHLVADVLPDLFTDPDSLPEPEGVVVSRTLVDDVLKDLYR